MKRPAYVSCYRDRHRVLRWRFRRPGYPQSQTRELYGSEAWWTWYAAADAAQKIEAGASRMVPGSISAVVIAYYGSADFKSLKPNTQATYRGILDRYRDTVGHIPAKMLRPKDVRASMDKLAATPSAANNLLKVLRAVMRFALDRGLVAADPTLGIRPLKNRTEGFHTWTEEEIAAFETRWPLGTRERLAFDLLLYTAQRSGDVRQMGRQHVRDGHVVVRQEKTGQPLEIMVHPRLKASIDAFDSGQLQFVVTQHGQPYTAKGFGNWISESARLAGLPPGVSAHGLRKAAARRLAEAGCTTNQIAAVTGHRTLKEVERYTRMAAQKALAGAALQRIGGGPEPEQTCLTPADPVRQTGS